MGFVKVENYDGEIGWIGSGGYFVIQLKDAFYLVHEQDIESGGYLPLSQAYRIVREGENTAVATIVKDRKVIEGLEKAVWKYLRECGEKDPTSTLSINNGRKED